MEITGFPGVMVCQGLGHQHFNHVHMAGEKTLLEMAFIEPLYRMANSRPRQEFEHRCIVVDPLLLHPVQRLMQPHKISSQNKTRTGGIDTFTLERAIADHPVIGHADGVDWG